MEDRTEIYASMVGILSLVVNASLIHYLIPLAPSALRSSIREYYILQRNRCAAPSVVSMDTSHLSLNTKYVVRSFLTTAFSQFTTRLVPRQFVNTTNSTALKTSILLQPVCVRFPVLVHTPGVDIAEFWPLVLVLFATISSLLLPSSSGRIVERTGHDHILLRFYKKQHCCNPIRSRGKPSRLYALSANRRTAVWQKGHR